jgi:hypothetical protein
MGAGAPERERRGEWEEGAVGTREGKKVKKSDMWVPQPVVGIEMRYREWMGAAKLNIE